MDNTNIDISTIKRVHFIGIGGIGMSALARLFLQEKKIVSGSDRSLSPITEALAKEGATIYLEQVADNITSDIDLIIYTEAMAKNHEEMRAASSLGVPMTNYFAALGLMVNPYYLIAVAGTHGKTTTTAMLTDVLEGEGLDPTAVIGSLRAKTGSNFRAGKSKYAVVEACEYRRDFLHLKPSILAITNIELDHVDYYADLRAVQDAFATLAEAVPEDGFIVTDTSHPNIAPILVRVQATVIDYRPFIDLNLSLRQPGLHNRQNAAVALAVASALKLDKSKARRTLEDFAGTWRRFEYKGKITSHGGEVPVYDDYAHHPTEIRATIAGARELYPDRKIVAVFQSHTYTRTHELFSDFISALALADEIYLLPIYAAREENVSGVSSEKMAEALFSLGKKVTLCESEENATLQIKENVSDHDVVLVMGAGDVTKVASLLVI